VTKPDFTEKYYLFRQLLIQTRKSQKLTQAQVATRLQKPQSFVSKYERGARRLDVVEFLEVARALGTTPYELLRKLEQATEVAFTKR